MPTGNVEGINRKDLFYVDPSPKAGLLRLDLERNRAVGDITELTESIRQQGVLQPIVVVKDPSGEARYLVVCGNSRVLAARAAGQDVRVPCVVRQMSEQEIAVVRLAENLQRKQLDPMEEAEHVARLSGYGWNAGEIAKRLGKSRSWVAQRLGLHEAPIEVQQAAREGMAKDVALKAAKAAPEKRERIIQAAKTKQRGAARKASQDGPRRLSRAGIEAEIGRVRQIATSLSPYDSGYLAALIWCISMPEAQQENDTRQTEILEE